MIYMKISKILAGLLIGFYAANGWAVDNSIYIDQAGSGATVTINQDGAGNRVKGILPNGNAGQQTDPAKINGDNMSITVDQVGANNVLALGIQSTTAAGATATSLNYSVSGGNNTGFINLNNDGAGTNSSTTIGIVQADGGNNTNVNVLGSQNVISVNQTGGAAGFVSTVNANETNQTVTTSGGTNNTVITTLESSKGSVQVSAVGSSNSFNVAQSGSAGTIGHQAVLDFNGSGNQVNVTQGGSIDTMVNIKSAGSNNAFSVTTKN